MWEVRPLTQLRIYGVEKEPNSLTKWRVLNGLGFPCHVANSGESKHLEWRGRDIGGGEGIVTRLGAMINVASVTQEGVFWKGGQTCWEGLP